MTDDELRKTCDTMMARTLLDVILAREEFNREPSVDARDKFEMSLLIFDEKVAELRSNIRELHNRTTGLLRCR